MVNTDYLKEWVKTHNREGADFNDIIKLEDFKKDVAAQMDKKEKEAALSGLEKVKKIHYTLEAFTVQNDILTPTFKIKRNFAKKYFEKEIADLYKGAQL